MNEDELDLLMQSRPWGTKDAVEAEAKMRRRRTLGIALWGETPDETRRQLLAPTPEIPAGFVLADFLELERGTRDIAAVMSNPKFAGLFPFPPAGPTIIVGTQRFTLWEARCEIVGRVIDHLENR
jgi:hypothetical protein